MRCRVSAAAACCLRAGASCLSVCRGFSIGEHLSDVEQERASGQQVVKKCLFGSLASENWLMQTLYLCTLSHCLVDMRRRWRHQDSCWGHMHTCAAVEYASPSPSMLSIATRNTLTPNSTWLSSSQQGESSCSLNRNGIKSPITQLHTQWNEIEGFPIILLLLFPFFFL